MDSQQPTDDLTSASEAGAAAPDSVEASVAQPSPEVPSDAAEDSGCGAEPALGDGRGERPRKPRRDPNETPFGGMFLDELQRVAGLRGQFAYGAPAKLWRANREQTIRILREDVPMPTYKNQIHCILTSDPIQLAQDVHFEMLSAAEPTKDSFRWLWLYMMLR